LYDWYCISSHTFTTHIAATASICQVSDEFLPRDAEQELVAHLHHPHRCNCITLPGVRRVLISRCRSFPFLSFHVCSIYPFPLYCHFEAPSGKSWQPRRQLIFTFIEIQRKTSSHTFIRFVNARAALCPGVRRGQSSMPCSELVVHPHHAHRCSCITSPSVRRVLIPSYRA